MNCICHECGHEWEGNLVDDAVCPECGSDDIGESEDEGAA